jgi:hypothetical protein
MAPVSQLVRARAAVAGELALLAYLQRMAAAARSEAERQLFALYVEKESRRLMASGLISLDEVEEPKATCAPV